MSRWWGGAVFIVALAALWDFFIAVRPALPPVSAAALEAAREAIEARSLPGTMVVHSPLFGVSEAAALGDLPARPDLPAAAVRARRRILVLDRAAAPMGGFGAAAETLALPDDLVLRRFEPSGEGSGRVVVYDLIDGLGPQSLSIERPVGRQVSACSVRRSEGGYRCPGQPDWLYAAPRQLRIDGKDQRCIWAHPTNGGAVVFSIPAPPAAPKGYALQLRVRSALTDDAVHLTSDGAAVRTRVKQGERMVGQVVRSNAIGWAEGRFGVDSEDAIRLEVTTAKDGRRHHCLDAQIVEVREEEG